MIKKFTTSLALGVLLLGACKKDDQSEMSAIPATEQDTVSQNSLMLETSATTHLLVRVEEDAKNYSVLTYTSGLITKIDTKEAGQLSTVNFTYDAKKVLKSALTKDGGMKFNYTGTLLTRVDFVTNPGSKVVGTLKYTYKNNKATEAIQYFKLGTKDVPAIKLAYTFTGNDVTTLKTYGYSMQTSKYSLSETTQTTYDTKKSPITGNLQLSQAFFQAFSAHNPLKEVITNNKGKVIETSTYTYTYDSAGYPLTQIQKIVKPGAATVTAKTKFTYK
jgi:hypothetical protein